MIFEALYESAQKGYLLLIDGGMCRYHIDNDHILTIREIISTRRGAGTEMLNKLKALKPFSIMARCPVDLPSNDWWKKKGFKLVNVNKVKTRHINTWVMG